MALASISYLSGVVAYRDDNSRPGRGIWVSQIGSGWVVPDLNRTENLLGLARHIISIVSRKGPGTVIDSWGVGFPPHRKVLPAAFYDRMELLKLRDVQVSCFSRTLRLCRRKQVAKPPTTQGTLKMSGADFVLRSTSRQETVRLNRYEDYPDDDFSDDDAFDYAF